MPFIEVIDISKSFRSIISGGKELLVVDKFSMKIDEGELVTIFGPNGCGKSTILNIIADILKPDSGKVIFNTDDQKLSSIGYVFQDHADTLLPWRTVKSNIAFPLELRNASPDEQSKKVDHRMNQLQLTEHAKKYIYELSGGLKQLVAIARATVYDPRLLLLDEPFSALDYSLSRMFWLRFREFWADQNVSTFFVSHNIDEAVFLGDRVYVLSARPAQVISEIRVPFGRKRNLEILTSKDFFEIRSMVLEAFEKGRRG